MTHDEKDLLLALLTTKLGGKATFTDKEVADAAHAGKVEVFRGLNPKTNRYEVTVELPPETLSGEVIAHQPALDA